MSDPTEGPWFVDGAGARAMVRGADQTIVAVRHRLPADINEANMHRIAGAPALLHELKRLVAALEPLECSGNWPLDSAGIATLNAARAAIAAAEGAKP
jgi:hypothetical protein